MRPSIAFVCGGVIFGLGGWYLSHTFDPAISVGGVLLQSSNFNNYQYIDPLLTCEIGGQDSFTDLASLKSALSTMVDQSIANGRANKASIYFRSLKDAHWFDINPEETYSPASLYKTFIMMAFYKESRDLNDPNLLERQIMYKGSANPNDDNPGGVTPRLVNGQSYSINNVIKQMIVYSDNDALNTLSDNFDHLTKGNLAEIFSDLQITSPLTENSSQMMSVDQYARIFRVLYTSTYLSRRLSEQALSLLAQAQFNRALAAGVPAGIPVAHKFGVRMLATTTTTTTAERELHDCGVIYYPQHPYIICVMTKGSLYADLIGVIKDLSAKTYEEMQAMSNN